MEFTNNSNILKNTNYFFREKYGNLFTALESVSLGHCVSRDFVMGKGIAQEFKSRFGRVQELKQQSKNVFCFTDF